MSQGCWFHKWLYLGEVPVIFPPLGPYDPRTDAERERTLDSYICVKCGKTKTAEIEYPSIW